jgi:hypothetical protein
VSVRRHAGAAVIVAAIGRDDAGDVCAVVVAGDAGRPLHVVLAGHHVGAEVDMPGVDPTVDHGDDVGAALRRGPGLGRVDLVEPPLVAEARIGRGAEAVASSGVADQVRHGVGDVRVALERAQRRAWVARADDLGAWQAEAAEVPDARAGADVGGRGAALALDDQLGSRRL